MLPPGVLQGEACLEVSLLGSPQWGLHPGHPLQPRYRWVQTKVELELGFVLELGLVLALELQLEEFLPLVALRLRMRKLLGFEPALGLGLPRELLVRLELQRLVQMELLLLVALRLRELEPLKFEPALALKAQHLVRLLVELQKQLQLELLPLGAFRGRKLGLEV